MAALPNLSRALALVPMILVGVVPLDGRSEDSIEVRSVAFSDVRPVGGNARWLEVRVELTVRSADAGGFVDAVQVDLGTAVRKPAEGFEFFRSTVRLATLETGRATVRFYLPPEIVARDRVRGEPFAWAVDVIVAQKTIATAVSKSLDSPDAVRGFRQRLSEAALNDGTLVPQHKSPFALAYPSDTPSAVRPPN